jgi:hypothetical protein
LWGELGPGYGSRRFNFSEDLNYYDLRRGRYSLDCHVGSYAETAISVGDVSLGMVVRRG